MLAPRSANALSPGKLSIMIGKEKLSSSSNFCGSFSLLISIVEHPSPNVCVNTVYFPFP